MTAPLLGIVLYWFSPKVRTLLDFLGSLCSSLFFLGVDIILGLNCMCVWSLCICFCCVTIVVCCLLPSLGLLFGNLSVICLNLSSGLSFELSPACCELGSESELVVLSVVFIAVEVLGVGVELASACCCGLSSECEVGSELVIELWVGPGPDPVEPACLPGGRR